MSLNINENPFITYENNHFFTTIKNNMPNYIIDGSFLGVLKKDEAIVLNSYPVNDVFIILSGELVVVNEFESGKIYEPVAIYNNDYIGVVEVILDYKEYISTVIATSEVTFVKIPKELFKRWIKEYPMISYHVLESVCKNFSLNMRGSGEQILLDGMYLLLSHILNNAQYDSGMNLFVLKESRDKTAKRTGINIRTLYRYIKKLKSTNYICLHQKRIAYSSEQKERLQRYSSQLRNQ